MTRMRRISVFFLFFGLCFAPAAWLHAQQPTFAPGNASAQAGTAPKEHMDEGASQNSIEQYTHSAVVQSIARHLHVSTDVAANLFEDFNSGVVILFIVWLLWKALPKMFRDRTERLAKELIEARRATEEANKLLAEVEARLMRLDTEIDAMRLQVEHEAAEEEKRIHAALESERERIIASAEQEIGAAQAGAQRELKKLAADLAIDHAMRRIQLSADTDRALVKEFGQKLGSGGEA